MKKGTCARAGLAVALLGLTMGAAPTALAQQTVDYPVDQVKLITHSSPGGGGDVFLREIVNYLDDIMPNVTFVVENVVGGSSAAALSVLAKAPKDGSLLYTTTPTFIYTSLLSELESDYTDVEGVVNVFYDPQVLYTRADAPFSSLKDVIEHAKSNRSAWGAASPGSLERIMLERLKKNSGVDAAIVTSEGGGETMINVLNGTLDVALGELLELRSQIDGGKLKLLAVFTEERLPDLPDLPTAKEQGVDLVIRKFRGLASPPGMAPEAIAAWEKAIPLLLEHPEYKKVYQQNSLVPAFLPHEETKALLQQFADENKKLMEEVGLIAAK